MSTSYYRLKEPFTSVERVEDGAFGVAVFRIGIRDCYAGNLAVQPGDVPDFLRALADRSNFEAVTSWVGCQYVLTTRNKTVGRNEPLISEYGELTTIDKIELRINGEDCS